MKVLRRLVPPRRALLGATLLLLAGAVRAAPSPAAVARIDSLNAVGRDYVLSNVAEAIGLYRDLAAEAGAAGYAAGRARALHHLSVALYLRGELDASVAAHLEATRDFERLGLQEDLAMAYGDLGYQMKRRDLPRALDYLRKGIAIAEAGDFTAQLCTLYDNYGVLQEMNAAPDSAAYFYHRALALKIARADSVAIPFSLNNLVGIHLGHGDFAAAESLLVRSDAYRSRPADTYGRLVNSVQWGDLYMHRGDLDDAARRYEASLQMPGADEQDYLVDYCLERLTEISEAQADWRRAYAFEKRRAALRDSTVSVETNERIAALEIEFETEKKDRLLAERQLAIQKRGRQVTVLVAVAFLLAAGVVGVARYQLLKRRQLQQEHALRSRLRRAEYEQRMADEKLRISRELHDNIGAQLTFLISSLDNLARGAAADDLTHRLEEVGSFGRTTLDELRQTVWAMRHEGEGLDALTAKLHELKRQCAAAGRELELEIGVADDADTAVSSPRLLAVVRIAQEAVQNAVKHAGAERISLRLEAVNGELRLEVADAGPGFDADAVDHVGGLANMRGRCRDAGGEFDLESGTGGTRIVCRFPPE